MPLIAVPFHLGLRGEAVGAGPLAILEGLNLPFTLIEAKPNVAAVNAALAQAVASHLPAVILAGNCNSCLGTLAAFDQPPGIVWFDAHGDFNTPETTVSGALEGMSLAIATGHCHPELMAKPVPEENVLLAATRDFDALEEVRLRASKIQIVSLDAFGDALGCLAARVENIYLHLDLDVLDPQISPGVNFSAPGGISAEQLFEAVRRVAATGKLAAAAITNFNPARDVEHKTLHIARTLVAILIPAS